MRIAIVGGGISGLYAAYLLHQDHDIRVFEAADYPGGHSNTVSVELGNQSVDVDTGFIVYNERNYPIFTDLLKQLGVATQDSDMSFSVSCRNSGLEYCGSSLNNLFAQRRNIFKRSFHRMILEIFRFNRMSEALINAPASQTLAAYLRQHNFSGMVVDDYLIPMAAAIWSSNPKLILDFPAAYFGRFFANHGLLTVTDQPQWRTITGGSKNYVSALINDFSDRVHCASPVQKVQRVADQVRVTVHNQAVESFDAVIFACHSDQALRLLDSPSPAEQRILGNIRFQTNDTVLHTDQRLMPDNQRAWAAWNYHRMPGRVDEVCVTYDMSHLQSLRTSTPILVTLNATDHVNPDTILQRFSYEHPIYDQAGVEARGQLEQINGTDHIYYCGAYWGYGFHEDGVRSAANVATAIREKNGDEELHLQRVG